MIVVELQAEGWPSEAAWQDLAEKAANSAVEQSKYNLLLTNPVTAEIAVRLTSDEQVHILNRDYRAKDMPTNVLSFPMFEQDELTRIDAGPPELLLGDVILAYDVCAHEASVKGVSLESHMTHLVVHGVLHLLGYDHVGDEEADEMEAIERSAMASLGLHNPYDD